jgi:hypothetical protein
MDSRSHVCYIRQYYFLCKNLYRLIIIYQERIWGSPTRACPRPAGTIDRKILHPFLQRIQFHWTNGVTRRFVGISFDVQLPLTYHGLIRFFIYVVNNLIKMLHLMHKCLLIYLFIYLFNLLIYLFIYFWNYRLTSKSISFLGHVRVLILK